MNVICLDSFQPSLLLFAGFLIVLIGSSFSGCLGKGSLIEVERGVLLTNWLDEILLVQIFDECPGDRSANLELLAKDGSSDAEDLWNFLEHSLVLLLIQEHGVVKLLLNLDLSPGLLLSRFTLIFTRLSIFGSGFTSILGALLLLLSLF